MNSNLAEVNAPHSVCPSKICYFPVSWAQKEPDKVTTNSADLRTIRLEDIPYEYRDIVEVIGMDAFIKLTKLCGGQSLYIPMMASLNRECRDREIRARFNGGNYRALATQFRLSERQIRKIIDGKRS